MLFVEIPPDDSRPRGLRVHRCLGCGSGHKLKPRTARQYATGTGIHKCPICGFRLVIGDRWAKLKNEYMNSVYAGRLSRCSGCGGMVIKPCATCAARKYKQEHKELTNVSGSD